MCYGCNKCNRCGKFNEESVLYVPAPTIKCPFCGDEHVDPAEGICPSCGMRVALAPGTSSVGTLAPRHSRRQDGR